MGGEETSRGSGSKILGFSFWQNGVGGARREVFHGQAGLIARVDLMESLLVIGHSTLGFPLSSGIPSLFPLYGPTSGPHLTVWGGAAGNWFLSR